MFVLSLQECIDIVGFEFISSRDFKIHMTEVLWISILKNLASSIYVCLNLS